MTKWEYLTLVIDYEKKRHKDWVLELEDGSQLIGMRQILKSYGDAGWELVSLQVARSLAEPGFGKWYIDPAAYRATFKRPLAA